MIDEKEEYELFFRPFSKLSGERSPILLLSEIQSLIDSYNYTLAEQKSKELMSLCLQGLRYFQTYDWLFLRGVVTAGYVGWCVFCLQFVIRHFVLVTQAPKTVSAKSQLTVKKNLSYKPNLTLFFVRLISCHLQHLLVYTLCCTFKRCPPCIMHMSSFLCTFGIKSCVTIPL
jgi:hypothetical protein